MATTSPDNIYSPDSGSQYAVVQDLGAMADSVQNALVSRANSYRGTSAQRAAFTTAGNGVLWQDTDGIKMIWRRDGATWVPAVTRWRGTTAQMNSFGANAPDGFEWFSTTDNTDHIRLGGTWYPRLQSGITGDTSVSGNSNGEHVISFPVAFPQIPMIAIQQASPGTNNIMVAVRSVSASGFTAQIRNFSSTTYSVSVRWLATL